MWYVVGFLILNMTLILQSTLSQLTLQQVQVVLDELCWRERYGHSAAQAYNNMMEHITYLTAKEAESKCEEEREETSKILFGSVSKLQKFSSTNDIFLL